MHTETPIHINASDFDSKPGVLMLVKDAGKIGSMHNSQYLCPSCRSPVHQRHFRYMAETRALRALQFPYLVCVSCCLYDFNKWNVRLIVASWKKAESALLHEPFLPIFERVISSLASSYGGDKENPPFSHRKFICTKKPR